MQIDWQQKLNAVSQIIGHVISLKPVLIIFTVTESNLLRFNKILENISLALSFHKLYTYAAHERMVIGGGKKIG